MDLRSIAVPDFRRDDAASVTLTFALMAIVLFACIGALVDYSRWNHAYARTVAAMDAALLVAGRHLQTESDGEAGALAAAQRYYEEQVKTRLLVDNPSVTFEIDQEHLAIVGKAHGDLATPFMGLVTVHSLPVNVEAKAAFAAGGADNDSTIEISMMLDVTGSMCDDGEGPCATGRKIDSLKTAAKDLVDIIVRDRAHDSKARIALVPFSTRVRVGDHRHSGGSDIMKSLTNLDPKWSGWYNICKDASGGGGSEGGGTWTCHRYESEHVDNWKVMPCVTDRTGAQEFTDAAPGANAWLNAHGGDRRPLSYDSSDTPITSGLGHVKADPAEHWNYNDDGSCADVDEANIVMPLSSDNHDLHERIDGLVAYGSTAGALGTAWAWYMLSPEWSGIWQGPSAPGPYSDLTAHTSSGSPKLKKIAVLMTDGLYNTWRWKDQDPQMVSAHATSICANMKASGIEIYTVGFELDQLSAPDRARAEGVLKACGTDLQHFYDAFDSDQLKMSFRDIALKLSTLYIAK